MTSQAKAAAGVASGQSPLGVLYMWMAGASEVTDYAKATGKDGGEPVIHNLIVESGGCRTTWAGGHDQFSVIVSGMVDHFVVLWMNRLRKERNIYEMREVGVLLRCLYLGWL